MRNFLLKLMATITRHPRYHPEDEELDHKIHWSNKIWVSNIFRAYEWLFGRGYGIRAEAATSIEEHDGKLFVAFHTFTPESLLSHIEATIRLQLAVIYEWSKNPLFLPVPKPVYLTLSILGFIFTVKTDTKHLWLFGIGAIAFDATANSTANATSLTYAHICTGSNLYLLVGSAPSMGGGENTNSITYAGASMTQQISQGDATNIVGSLWDKVAPATGANNIIISVTSAANIYSVSASYSGVKQSAQPDATASSFPGAGGAATITTNLTTVADNSWVVNFVYNESGNAMIASTNVNAVRGSNSSHAYLGDSNGVVHPAGAFNMTWTCTSQVIAAVGISFSPAPAVISSISQNRAFFM